MEERGLFEATNRLAVLKEISEALNEANDMSGAMTAILPKLSEALGLKTAWAFRYDPTRRSFVEVGASGLPPALACCNQQPLKEGGCECQGQFKREELHHAVNIVRCSRLSSAVGDKQNLHFHASIPLRSKGVALGILNVAAEGATVFTEEALAFLQTVGQQVAIAVDRARMLQRERTRSQKLQAVNEIASCFHLDLKPEVLFQEACESFVRICEYEACAVTIEGSGTEEDVIAVAAAAASGDAGPELSAQAANSSRDVKGDSQGMLVRPALSQLAESLPLTPYTVRIESRIADAFDSIDKEILQSFALTLATAYVNTLLYQQGLDRAHWLERRRIAADLHDAVSQRLFSAQLLLSTASLQAMDNGTSNLSTTLKRVKELLTESQAEMRGLIRALRPQGDSRTLLVELQSRVRTLSLNPSPKVRLLAPEKLVSEPVQFIRDSLLSIIDEALHNALRHAHATDIVIQVEESPDEIVFVVQDNGRGYSDECATGLGTETMRERAERIGGWTRMESSSMGTTVSIHMPCTRRIDPSGGHQEV